MSIKQDILAAVSHLPENSSSEDVWKACAQAFAKDNPKSLCAQLVKANLTLEDLNEYLNPQFDVSINDLLQELRNMDQSTTPRRDVA